MVSIASKDLHQNNFDLIRLYAACQVALAHSASHLRVALPSAAQWLDATPGVPIFFIVSGFLISASFERNPDLASYFRNRFLRIYPALWTCLLVTCVTLLLLYHPADTPSPMDVAGWLLAQLSIGQFYTADFLRGYGVGTPNGSLWTIPVELQFYLLLPLLFLLFVRLRWSPVLVAALIVFLAVVNQFYAALGATSESLFVKLLGVTVLPYLYLFFLGIALNVWRERLMPLLAGKALYWLAAYAIALAAMAFLDLPVTGNMLHPLLAIMLGLLVVSCAYTMPQLADRVLRRNDISYGVYVYHMVVVNVFVALGQRGAPLVLVLSLLITVILGTASWILVERPALRLKHRSSKPLSVECMASPTSSGAGDPIR